MYICKVQRQAAASPLADSGDPLQRGIAMHGSSCVKLLKTSIRLLWVPCPTFMPTKTEANPETLNPKIPFLQRPTP